MERAFESHLRWSGPVDYHDVASGRFPAAFRPPVLARDAAPEWMQHHLAQHHKPLFFTKMHDYRDEQEFRYVIVDTGASEYTWAQYGMALETVVLGEQFPRELVPRARQQCESSGVGMAQISWLSPFGPRLRWHTPSAA